MFQNKIHEKEIDRGLQQELQKIIQEQDELIEIEKIRQSQNFKATPIKNYKFIMGEVEKKELTVPRGPHLSTEKRSQMKM